LTLFFIPWKLYIIYWNESAGGTMARNDGKKIPRTHTIRKIMANEIYHIVFSGKDKSFKKDMIKEIDAWLAHGNFFYDENPAELAKEWQESRRDAY
jgi:hypothetical protein